MSPDNPETNGKTGRYYRSRNERIALIVLEAPEEIEREKPLDQLNGFPI